MLKEEMLDQLHWLHDDQPDPETNWHDALQLTAQLPPEYSPCCLLTYLCYYGYYEEDCLSVSEHARRKLSPLMKPN